MLSDLFAGLGWGDLLGGGDSTPTVTLTVAKPFCSPARHLVTGALGPYGVKIYKFSESTKFAGVRGMARQMGLSDDTFDGPSRAVAPLAQVARVEVSQRAAAWAEYLLLRTGKLYVVGDYQNPRNAEWARRHGGTMPVAWGENRPMLERSCKEGVKAWEQLQAVAAKAKKGGGGVGSLR